MGFDGEWREVVGNVTVPFYMMIHGGPGSGKSTFAIKFADYLNRKLNKNVLYIAAEETDQSATFKDKMERANAMMDGLYTSSKIIPFDDMDVVFIDSVQMLKIEPEEMAEMMENARKNNISIVFVFHETKGGTYRGDTTFEHLIDIRLQMIEGATQMHKNRMGGGRASMYVY